MNFMIYWKNMQYYSSTLLAAVLFSCGSSKQIKSNTTESWENPPQHCNVTDSSDWKDVGVSLMEEKAPPKWLDLQGEDIFKLKKSVTEMHEIPKGLITKMKQRCAEFGACILFVDLRDYYGSEMFPMRKESEVYFYWGIPK